MTVIFILYLPDYNLSRSFPIFLGNLLDLGIVQELWVARLGPGPVWGSQRTVSSHYNPFRLIVFNQFLLVQVRMNFNLELRKHMQFFANLLVFNENYLFDYFFLQAFLRLMVTPILKNWYIIIRYCAKEFKKVKLRKGLLRKASSCMLNNKMLNILNALANASVCLSKSPTLGLHHKEYPSV